MTALGTGVMPYCPVGTPCAISDMVLWKRNPASGPSSRMLRLTTKLPSPRELPFRKSIVLPQPQPSYQHLPATKAPQLLQFKSYYRVTLRKVKMQRTAPASQVLEYMESETSTLQNRLQSENEQLLKVDISKLMH